MHGKKSSDLDEYEKRHKKPAATKRDYTFKKQRTKYTVDPQSPVYLVLFHSTDYRFNHTGNLLLP